MLYLTRAILYIILQLMWLFYVGLNILTNNIVSCHLWQRLFHLTITFPFPLQVIVGSFITDSPKQSKSTHQMEPLFAPPKHASGGPTGANSSPSRGTLSESSGGPGSPLNQSAEACYNSNPQGMSSMPWKWFLFYSSFLCAVATSCNFVFLKVVEIVVSAWHKLRMKTV